MGPVDSAAQCLIEYDGQWFLCPRYKKDEALAHFAQVDDRLSSDQDYLPPAMPDFLSPISDPTTLVFFGAEVEQGS